MGHKFIDYAPRGSTVILSDDTIVPFHDTRGNVQVVIQDQFTDIVDLQVSIPIDTADIVINTAIDDTVVRIDSATTPVVGDLLCLKEFGGTKFFQGEILVVTPIGGTVYDVTVDSPLDFAYTTAHGCSLRDKNLNKDGSVTPVIAELSPEGLIAAWDITRMIVFISDGTSMDISTFGGLPALTRGVVFRKKNTTFKNIFNAKSNGDFGLHSYDITFDDRAAAGFFGFRSRRSFSGQDKNGVTIRLDPNESPDDAFQTIIQDDLTGLIDFRVVIQGHVVE
jgi:hypothetical protein